MYVQSYYKFGNVNAAGKMPHCAVKLCPIRSSAKSRYQTELETRTQITFHRFPKADNRRIQWAKCLGLQLDMPNVRNVDEDNFPQESQVSHALMCKAVLSPATNEQSPSHSGSEKRCPESDDTCGVDTMMKRQRNTSILDKASVQYLQTTSDISTQTTFNMDGASIPVPTCEKATAMSPDRLLNSPRKLYLRKTMQHQQETSRKTIQALKKKNQRQGKRIAALKSVLNEIRAKNLLAEEHYDVLKTIGRSNVHILKRLVAKTAGREGKGKKAMKLSREYSPEIRTFTVTLQYYSPRAYNYVREHFDSCLPHPKTISSWYRSINADPGFIDEAFACIAERVKAVDYQLIGTLVFDEMSIRQHVEYEGTKFCGYVDFGANIALDSTTIAKEALVFLFVCMNGAWKIPIGYFLIHGVTSDQKCNLILQSLSLLHEAGVRVAALTFDGAPANLSTVNKFECNLNPDSLQTHFMHPITKEKVFIFPDPSHMAKLVRNIFGDEKF